MRGRALSFASSAMLWLGGCLGGSSTDGGLEGGGGDEGGVPSAGDCASTSSWDAAWAAVEEDVLRIVNEHRAAGASCGSQSFGPTSALVMQSNLRCAARLHSRDMVDRDYFSHDNPDGQSPWDRMEEAGYTAWRAVGENIAAGNPTAAATMEQWMNSPGHCANIMNPEFTEIGVGYYPGGSYRHMWTQKFGRR